MNSTFRLLFYARWQKRKANGKVPLYARVTIDGTKVEFNVKMDVSEKIWDPKFGRASGNSREAVTLNQYLTSIAGKLKEKYLLMTEQGLVVTASMLKDAYLGVNIKTNTLLGIFKEFNDRQESLIGIEIAQSTFNKYDLTYRRLQEFLRVKKKTSDILLWHLDRDFVLDFAAFLRIEYKLDTNSSEKLMRIFKRITTMCFKNGQMPKDPFCEHKIKKVKKDRGYLTKHELDKILEYTPDCKRMEKVRDIFVFCCFTGLDYSTVASLRDTDIVIGDDSSLWIYKDRVKTGIQSRIKLLSIPLAIIKKYEATKSGSYVLPVMSNAKYNAYLKELAEGCGIEKKITTHLARHTFATTVTLANGVPIETVSKMLGHTKITTTQIYARAIDKKVSDDMDSLAKKLETDGGFAFAG